MFPFHSIPVLDHLRQPPYRAMASPPATAPPATTPPTAPFRFLDLPLELREQIYSLYYRPADRLRKSAALESQGYFGGVYDFELKLGAVCRQVAKEARRVWRREVRTVKIGTPWPSAVNHISSEGLVPIVCTDRRADSFTDHHAYIQITAPFHQTVPEYTVVLLLEDIHLFTQTWYYSALSYPMLNDRLSTSFTLRDPDMDDIDMDTSTAIPLPLQRALLLPFSQIKGLHSLTTTGFHPSVQKTLRASMAVPPPTLRQSCESSTHLLHTGDVHLARGAPGAPAALHAYTAAFHAIHILVAGRTRRVLADPFFHASIPAGPYAGQTGMTVRVILRLRLVARVLAAHLALGAWGDAAFWGMRSVRIMSESMDVEFEDFLADLVGGDDVGLVYVRAGIALWMMRREPDTWREEMALYEGDEGAVEEVLWKLSLKHFKRGCGAARREVQRFGVPVGVFAEEGGGCEA